MLNILGLLSKEVVFLVMISLLIAVPLAWYAAQSWLQGFAYNVNLGWGFFLSAFAIAIGIALLTVSYHTLVSALSKPVESSQT